MFRYIALSWDSGNVASQQTAMRLGLKLQMPGSGWQTVLVRPGLCVFTAGEQPRVNTAYPLLPDQGVILGKLFRRSELDRPLAPDVSLTAHDAVVIMRSKGRALIDDYWGRYIAILYDAASGGTRLLRDPTGTLPCHLIHHGGVRIIFSWLEDVLTMMPSLPIPTISWDYMAVHVPADHLESRETALKEVTQVIAGEAVLLSGRTMTSELYWSAVDIAAARSDESPAKAAAALRRTVRACVQSWAQCYDHLMLRLSGGLDSSILVSCLAEGSTPARVTCINYYSAGSDSDERGYARLAAASAGRELIECERDPRFLLKRILVVARTPRPSYYLGRLGSGRMDAELAASRGAPVVFTGGGGDQLFYQFHSVRPAADYLRLHGLDSGFPSAAMDAARLGRATVWKAVRLAFLDRLRWRAPDPRAGQGEFLALVKPEILAAARRDRRFLHPALHSISHTPIGKLEQIQYLIYPTEYYDPVWLESSPEALHPLLSQPVVELCLRLPTYLLSRGGRGRALARQAFAADLPAEIARRRSKGGMEEHMKAILLRNLDFVRDMLLDGALVREGILDRAKLEEVLSGRPTAIPSYMMELDTYLNLEVWLNLWSACRRQKAAA
jgi:asparagine synthase (glutamine-hydrolysing)